MEKKELYDALSDEDNRDKVIKELTPEENKLALEILEEKIDETPDDEDTLSISKEPGSHDDDDETDTSGDDKDKDGDEKKPDGDDDEKKADDKDFLLTDELIEAQPEENRGILSKYKDKSKEDLAQAVAHAIALKSPYLKDNEKMITQMKDDFLTKTGDELINILVDVQKETGKSEKSEPVKPEKTVIEFPEIPEDDPAIKKVLEAETLKRLKAKYPNMPEVAGMDDEEYKEWRRDLDVDNPDNEFRTDKVQAEKAVKEELSKVVYIQKNLSNLYEESPSEVLPLLADPDNLPRLKQLNDNPMDVLVQDLGKEIETIRTGLKKYGLTEKDLELDLTIGKDEKGLPYNETLNNLILGPDNNPSSEIIGQRGKVFWLKPGQLARKFKDEFDDKILTAYVNKKIQTDKVHKEKLKSETLREAHSVGKSGKKVMTVEDIEKLSPEENRLLLEQMERSI